MTLRWWLRILVFVRFSRYITYNIVHTKYFPYLPTFPLSCLTFVCVPSPPIPHCHKKVSILHSSIHYYYNIRNVHRNLFPSWLGSLDYNWEEADLWLIQIFSLVPTVKTTIIFQLEIVDTWAVTKSYIAIMIIPFPTYFNRQSGSAYYYYHWNILYSLVRRKRKRDILRRQRGKIQIQSVSFPTYLYKETVAPFPHLTTDAGFNNNSFCTLSFCLILQIFISIFLSKLTWLDSHFNLI